MALYEESNYEEDDDRLPGLSRESSHGGKKAKLIPYTDLFEDERRSPLYDRDPHSLKGY